MTWRRRDVLAAAGTAAAAFLVSRASAIASTERASGATMATTWHAVAPPGAMPEFAAIIETVFARVDGIFSPYRPHTELARLNAHRGTGGIVVSPELAAVVVEGQRVAGLTDGAFNPAVGGLVGRFGFGPIAETGSTNPAHLEIRNGVVRKLDRGATFDPCGIAKGYALDLVAEELAAAGFNDFLVELGGEVLARGRHPSGRSWQAGIENPDTGGARLQRLVRIGGNVLATSSRSANSYRVGTRLYHHIIDPRTFEPAESELVSVSVITKSGMTADALATGFMVMGPEAGPALADRGSIAALFLLRHRPGGELVEIRSAALAPHILA